MSEAPASIRNRTTAGPRAIQASFDELGTPLRDVTFVVVDLETTGGSPSAAAITEVGAVKVRGGEVLGTFQTLVNPAAAIPPFIAVLTGITDAMVSDAPRIDSVLPAFLEFARDAVLVAHNAPFDLGFLKAACLETTRPWPGFDHVDTARLARRVLTRDEAPDCRLATLARVFRVGIAPCHRALADAQATVDVLHGLIARLGSLGVGSLEELRTFSAQVSLAQRRKRHLAEPLPHAPGVYLFRDGAGRVLYVGTSRDLRTRVRQYFVASEERSRMAEMIAVAERVDHIVCAHTLEAEVRELRLIAEHKPRYNRRSRHPEQAVYLKLTVEPFPRLALVRRVLDDGADYLGPFGSAGAAQLALTAVHEALPLRQCSSRLSPRRHVPACVLAEIGRCGAPCDGREAVESYAAHVQALRTAIRSDPRQLVGRLSRRIDTLARAQRFEEAARHRDRLTAFVAAAARLQALSALAGCPELIAARPAGHGGWEVAVVRHGRLVTADTVPAGASLWPRLDLLTATAEVVGPVGPGPTPCATAEEMQCILRWLGRPQTRLVALDGKWASPAYGAGGLRALVEVRRSAGDAARPLADRRRLRPDHRPAREPMVRSVDSGRRSSVVWRD